MRVIGTRHGERAAFVFDFVISFVFDGIAYRLLLHVRREAAALDHETIDDAMENCAVVVAGSNVIDKVLCCLGGFFGVEFYADDAEIGMQFDHLEFLSGVISKRGSP